MPDFNIFVKYTDDKGQKHIHDWQICFDGFVDKEVDGYGNTCIFARSPKRQAEHYCENIDVDFFKKPANDKFFNAISDSDWYKHITSIQDVWWEYD